MEVHFQIEISETVNCIQLHISVTSNVIKNLEIICKYVLRLYFYKYKY